MSNPEKSQEGYQQLGHSQQGDFPPPPPGPPPAQSQYPEQHQYAQPPQYDQQQQQQQQQQQHQHQEQPPYYPPPPGQAEQQFPPPPQQPHDQQQQQQQQYAIPAYNPAAPTFAPPPTEASGALPSEPVAGAAAAVSSQHQPAYTSEHEQQQQQHGHVKKSGWSERFSHLGAKAAAPINSLAHKLGSQSFLPEPLDKECDKAAAILRAFCSKHIEAVIQLLACTDADNLAEKGVYADPGAGQPPTSTNANATESTGGVIDPTKEKPKNRVLVTIPPKVISRAVGLAIFTTLRAGFQFSGATGSGILIARLPDGSWGPPSGIQVHSVGGGFQIGLDIYDCVCVINSKEALAAFTNTRVSLGSDLTVVAGPYGAGGAVDFGASVDDKSKKDAAGTPTDASTAPGQQQTPAAQTQTTLQPGEDPKKSHRRSLSASAFKPVFSYVKSRGFYAGIQVEGTVVVERKDANAAFYGAHASVDQILKGQVPQLNPQGSAASLTTWPAGAKTLLETLKGAEAGALTGTTTPPVAGESVHAGVPPAAGSVGLGGAPPVYQDDGKQHPAVGDVKYA
ncbi:hypothetical protein Purlil1_10676 [Purpureocillium lilacinum]|uniref:Ysc84 actin-binding domain-containing protein n=1 Tax=Purpureocillium lilacinum TaxID=33203 RepID=A0ABR0BMG8_PURLI|nr:hypothetical protein Purlil1_10676 [Purpureocillium lilacinum]